ncbi:MAG: hypothetical protein IPP82_04980 [Xanthomonadales bacterium]|nr:hypothetical protein [Xanthomonadales bacterium]
MASRYGRRDSRALEARRANAQTALATTQAERAGERARFPHSCFHRGRTRRPRLAPPSVADVVRVSIADAQHSRALEPSVRIELLEALGKVLPEQGALDEGVALLAANRANAVAELGTDHPVVILAGIGLAEAQAAAGERNGRARSSAIP